MKSKIKLRLFNGDTEVVSYEVEVVDNIYRGYPKLACDTGRGDVYGK